jgi:hypothetical protein
MKQNSLIAGGNLAVAQQRDTLRYGRIRDGGYLPKIKRFAVGDYVYVQESSERTTLQVKARREIFRVHKLGEKGAIIIIGKCGGTRSVNAINCAPCLLIGIDGTIHRGITPIPKAAPCRICGLGNRFKDILLCDGCDKGYHMDCLRPQLRVAPVGAWYCATPEK